MSTLTKEQFIQWSFERDMKCGLFCGVKLTFNELDAEEKASYQEESDYYFSGERRVWWPDDIIERAKREGIELPEYNE